MTIPTVVDGEVIDITWGNAVADTLNTYSLGAWTTFTPTWNNVTLGNGSSAGSYVRVPGGVRMRARLTIGTTTASTGGISVTPPFDALVDGIGSTGVAILVDVSNEHIGQCYNDGSGGAYFVYYDTNNVVDTNPFGWSGLSQHILVDVTIPTNPLT